MRPKVALFIGLGLVLVVAGILLVTVVVILVSSPGISSPLGSKVALIRLEGAIYDSTKFLEELKSCRENKRIKALVVRIESPGGAVAASQEIFSELRKYREGERTGRRIPVVASMGNLGASGGYYAACAADRIVCNPGTLTGSIGVIFSTAELTSLVDKIGMKFNTVKSGEFKDTGSATRPMTDADRKVLQGLIDNVHQQFIEDVADGRREAILKVLAEENATSGAAAQRDAVKQYVASLADGRVYTGKQAYESGLVDQMGTLQDAIESACDLAGIPRDSEVIERTRRASIVEALFGSAEESLTRFFFSRASAPLQYRLP